MKDKRIEVMNTMNRINRKLFTANGVGDDAFLGRGQVNVLKEIINNEKIVQDELASALKLDKTTVAKAVKKLEIHGLIIRNRSETDLRKKELVATEKALLMDEKMSRYLDESTKSLFEDISDEEIIGFKSVLEKIELNLERNRKIMIEKRHLAMEALKVIEENESITIDKLTDILNKEPKEIKKVIGNLSDRGLVEEKDNVVSLNQSTSIKERKKDMNKMKHMRNKEGHEEFKELFMYIMKNNGISKDELVEKSAKSADEIDDMIKKFESRGVIEIKDGKLYADKQDMMNKHGRK